MVGVGLDGGEVGVWMVTLVRGRAGWGVHLGRWFQMILKTCPFNFFERCYRQFYTVTLKCDSVVEIEVFWVVYFLSVSCLPHPVFAGPKKLPLRFKKQRSGAKPFMHCSQVWSGFLLTTRRGGYTLPARGGNWPDCPPPNLGEGECFGDGGKSADRQPCRLVWGGGTTSELFYLLVVCVSHYSVSKKRHLQVSAPP